MVWLVLPLPNCRESASDRLPSPPPEIWFKSNSLGRFGFPPRHDLQQFFVTLVKALAHFTESDDEIQESHFRTTIRYKRLSDRQTLLFRRLGFPWMIPGFPSEIHQSIGLWTFPNAFSFDQKKPPGRFCTPNSAGKILSREALQKPSLILRPESFYLLHRPNFCANDCSGYFWRASLEPEVCHWSND